MSEVSDFVTDLSLSKMKGSFDMALRTVELLINLVENGEWRTANQLIKQVKDVREQLDEADPTQTVPQNMCLRLLKIIRDEYNVASGHSRIDMEESFHKIMVTDDQENYEEYFDFLKTSISDSLRELSDEIETGANNIAAQSLEHIYPNEVIMTLGHSKSVEAFLKFAAKKNRKFEVIVAESAPFCNGHEMAKNLTSAKIKTTLIPDSAMFTIMSKVSKVVIGTHSVMANGGLKALSGAHSLALAAKHYSVPLIVCTAMFKLTPLYLVSHDQFAFNRFDSPNKVLPFESNATKKTDVINPVFDYVPPELVTILVSNIGGNAPSYIYRLLSELYHRNDYLGV